MTDEQWQSMVEQGNQPELHLDRNVSRAIKDRCYVVEREKSGKWGGRWALAPTYHPDFPVIPL